MLVLVCAITFAVVYAYFKWKYRTFKSRAVPFIEPTFPAGSSISMLTRKENFAMIISKFYFNLKFQGVRLGGFFIFSGPTYLACHPETIKNILNKDFLHFTDHTLFINEKDDPLTGHLFALGGTKWRNMRVKLTPTFTSGKMKVMYPLIAECGRQLVDAIHDFSVSKQPIHIKEYFARFATDVIGTCAFGLECNSFQDNDAKFRAMGKKIFSRGGFGLVKRIFMFSFPGLAQSLRMRLINKEVSDFFIRTIDDTITYRKKNKVVRRDFLQLLMEIQETQDLTLEELSAQCFVFFLAGFETSATLVTFCLYELAKNEHIQRQAREEVLHVYSQNGDQLPYEALQDLKYLECVLEEALRKYPPFMLLSRQCTKDWIDPDTNVHIKKGETVFIPTYGIQHDPEYFPNPEKFVPGRFAQENRNKIVPFTYLPFGEGPRNCIGLRFGMMQSKVGVAMLLKQFKFTLSKRTKEPLVIDPNNFVFETKDPIFLDVEEL